MIKKIKGILKSVLIVCLLTIQINDAALVAQAENNRVRLKPTEGYQTLEVNQGRKESRLITNEEVPDDSISGQPSDSGTTPEPTLEPTQEPENPVVTPEPTIEPSQQPEPTESPEILPTLEPQESIEPEVPSPTPTIEPTLIPTVSPSSTPEVTIAPTMPSVTPSTDKTIFSLSNQEESQTLTEIVEERTENSKTYDLGEGVFKTDVYLNPVHRKVDDEFVEINTNLDAGIATLSNEGEAVIAQNHDVYYDIQFFSGKDVLSQIANDKGVGIKTIANQGNTSSFLTESDTIQYFDVYPNVDFQYRIMSTAVKENILLKEGFTGNELRYLLEIGDLNPEKDDTGMLLLKDNLGEVQFTYELPYLMDAAFEALFDINLNYERINDNQIEIIITWDNNWSESENRVYPIIIDPVITPRNDYNTVDVTSSYVRSTDGKAIQSKNMRVGYESRSQASELTIEWARSVIHFKMPDIGAGMRIIDAKMKLFRVNGYVDHAGIDVYSTNSYLDPAKANYYNLPEKKKISNVSAQSLMGTGYKEFDITAHAKDLYAGTDKTLILISQDEYDKTKGPNVFMTEGNTDRPLISLTYSVDADIDSNLDPNKMLTNLRIYSKGINQFYGMSIDGILKPRYYAIFYLNKLNEKGEIVRVGKDHYFELNETPGTSYIDPIFVTSPVEGVQHYEKEPANFTTPYMETTDFAEDETVYLYEVEISQDQSGRYGTYTSYTDRFLFHKVRLGETLPSLAAYYGVPIEQIQFDNNTTDNVLIEGQNIVIRIPSDTLKPNADSFRPPVTITEYTAEYKYRGDVCLFACYAADPVNVGSGNYYHSNVDIKLKGYENIELKRFYNSSGEIMSSLFGNNFTTNFDQFTFYDENQNLYYLTENGRIYQYLYNNGSYSTDIDNPFTLSFNDNKIVITDEKTHNVMYFNEYGLLDKIQELNGQFIKPVYDEYGMIRKLSLSDASEVIFNYNDQNMVQEIILPDATKVYYEYNENRQLTKFTNAQGYTETYSYDEAGHINEIVDENGDSLGRNTYDNQNRVVRQMDGEDNVTTFEYQQGKTIVTKGSNAVTYYVDSLERVTKIEFSDGTSRTNDYSNVENQLLYSTNELGAKAEFTYNSYGDIEQTKDFDGKIESYEKNEYGFPTRINYSDGSYETFTYDNQMNVLTHRNKYGKTESYAYNDKSQVIEHVDFYNGKTQMEYTGSNLTRAVLPNGEIVVYEYDELNHLKKENHDGYSISYAVDAYGRNTERRYSTGKTEKWEYDGRGNTTKYTDPNGVITTTEYNSMDLPVKVTRGNLTESYTYDAEGRKTSYTDKFGKTETYVYDIKGNLIETTDKYGNKTTNTYDEASNLIKTVDSFGNSVQYTFTNGLLTAEINERGEKTIYEYDSLKRLTKTTYWNGQTIVNEYNDQGLISKTTDSKGIVTEYLYDAAGKETKVTVNGISESKTYNADGNLIEEIDKNGIKTQYGYDINGNQNHILFQDGTELFRVYDIYGNMISETDQLGHTKTIEYDAAGNVIKETDRLGNNETYTYNGLSQLVESRDKEGFVTTYEYNDYGMILKEISPRDFITAYEYDGFGNLIKKYIDNVLVEENHYDNHGRVTETKTLKDHITNTLDAFGNVLKKVDHNTLLETNYEYDVHGNLIKESNTAGQQKLYTYDTYNRLKTMTNSLSQVVTYEYDVFDNIIKETNKGIVTEMSYSAKGELLSRKESGVTTSYEYDIFGNAIKTLENNKLIEMNQVDALSQVIKTTDALGNFTTFIYDAEGNLCEETDKNGNKIKHEYDKKGQEIKTTDALGNVFTYVYDADGNQIESKDPAGNKTTTQYNAFSQPVKEVDARGFLTEYVYNAKQQLITKKLPYNYQVNMTYDNAGNNISVKDTRGNISYTEYNSLGYLVKEKTANDGETTYSYDLEGQLTEKKYPNTLTEKYEYDSRGNLIKFIRNGNVIQTNTYNSMNRVVTEKDALNNTISYEYDTFGNVTKITNGNLITVNEYDMNRQLVKSTINNAKVFEYSYDKNGNQTTVKQNDRLIKQLDYNGNNQVVMELSQGVKKYTDYNCIGKISEEGYLSGDKKNILYRYEYDASGNIIKQTDNQKHEKIFTYDAFNNKIEEIDTNGNSTRFAYDGEGNLTKVEDAENRVVNYTYDNVNNLIKKSYSVTQEATYTYNLMGQMISSHDEYGINLSMQYDLLGNKTKLIKADKKEINYEYDLSGNLVKEFSGDIKNTFTYDAHGNRLTSSDYSTETRTYDAYDRLIRVKDVNGNVVEYEYDLFDNQTKIIITDNSGPSYYADEPTGPQINIQLKKYNDWNQLIEVYSDDEGSLTTPKASYTYDDYGHVNQISELGLTITVNYDIYGQLSSKTTKSKTKIIHDLQYTYDGEGNVLTEKVKSKYDINSGVCKEEYTNVYTYDKMNQLKSSTKKDIQGNLTTTNYFYNYKGDRIAQTPEGNEVYIYNDHNMLERIETAQGVQRFYYSANGEVTQITSTNSSTYNFSYDLFGNLTYLDYGDSSLRYNYSYDANDNMTGFKQTYEVNYNNYNEVIPYADGPEIVETYYYFVNDVSLTNIEQLEYISKSRRYGGSNTFFYYGLERLGSGNTLYHTSLNGTVAFTTNSDTLGNIYSITDNYYYEDYGLSNKYGFSLNGEYKDPSGIIHLRNRAYLPQYAMFLQLDDYTGTLESITSQNRRTFANNNPYRFYDKTGNNAEEVRATAQANQNQTGYDINYVKAQVGQDYNQDEGEPIMPLDGETLPWGWGVSLLVDEVNHLIQSGKISLHNVLRELAKGAIMIICAVGLTAYVNTYELQQEHEATIPQTNIGGGEGVLDNSSSYHPVDGNVINDLRNALRPIAASIGMITVLNKMLPHLLDYYKKYPMKINNKEKHHVVPKAQGSPYIRKIIKAAGIDPDTDKRDRTLNIANIYYFLHKIIHSAIIKPIYLKFIYDSFIDYAIIIVHPDPVNVTIVRIICMNIRDALEAISDECGRVFKIY